jgi:ubiquinone/menaquinone biosynthesis C-methylase UbiE
LEPETVTDPYEVLAEVYDAVMDHVDYDRWARYLHTCLETHGESVTSILELGGGTGSLAVRLQPKGTYQYVMTDGSRAMVRKARQKVDAAGLPIRCDVAGFTTVSLQGLGRKDGFDAIVLVYDGLNYLTDIDDVYVCLERIRRCLSPGGVAVVDHATPANSEDHDREFFDRGTVEGTSYLRCSRYDADTGLHRTTFDIVHAGTHYKEEHVQRPYAPAVIEDAIEQSGLHVSAAYDGFTFDPAHERSHRVHWLLERRRR